PGLDAGPVCRDLFPDTDSDKLSNVSPAKREPFFEDPLLMPFLSNSGGLARKFFGSCEQGCKIETERILDFALGRPVCVAFAVGGIFPEDDPCAGQGGQMPSQRRAGYTMCPTRKLSIGGE